MSKGSAAYNRAMQNRRLSSLLAVLIPLGAATATAQTQPPASATPAQAAPARPERAVERMRIQDAGSRIDELRVGGETQSISVQPAGSAPAYEVRPADASRAPAGSAGQDGAGARFWNVLKF